MFKIKLKNISKKTVQEVLDIEDSVNEYTYVITDDPSMCEEDKINIVFNKNNIDSMKKVVRQLVASEAYYITVENSQGTKKVSSNNIEYFEAFDNEVFAKVGKERYYVLEKLYVLENTLSGKNYVRVSKSCVVNILRIDYIRPMLNYKLKLIMKNGDTIEVNRTYTKSFKERIKN